MGVTLTAACSARLAAISPAGRPRKLFTSIETKAAARRRDCEISVALRDLRECVPGIGCSAWPLQRRHDLVRPALRRERTEKEFRRGNAPFSPTRLQHDGPTAYDESERYLSTRIRVRDRTAERSAVARLEM